MNFAVSGTGRCALKWLAGIMDRSPTWAVVHEPSVEMHLEPVEARFHRPLYGECNPYLLPVMERLHVKRALVLRHPLEVVVSAWNKGHDVEATDFVELLYVYLSRMDILLQAGARPFSYRRMTSDLDYLRSILGWADIMDVETKAADLTAVVNASPKIRCYGQIVGKGAIERATDWFSEKYKEHL